jgi:hypothetical protein
VGATPAAGVGLAGTVVAAGASVAGSDRDSGVFVGCATVVLVADRGVAVASGIAVGAGVSASSL